MPPPSPPGSGPGPGHPDLQLLNSARRKKALAAVSCRPCRPRPAWVQWPPRWCRCSYTTDRGPAAAGPWPRWLIAFDAEPSLHRRQGRAAAVARRALGLWAGSDRPLPLLSGADKTASMGPAGRCWPRRPSIVPCRLRAPPGVLPQKLRAAYRIAPVVREAQAARSLS